MRDHFERTDCCYPCTSGKSSDNPDKPNALRRVLFEPIICWVIDACRNAGIEKICIATNCREDLIRTISDSSIEIATEENHLGTGCIPKSISGFLSRYEDADVAVLNGDTPFWIQKQFKMRFHSTAVTKTPLPPLPHMYQTAAIPRLT